MDAILGALAEYSQKAETTTNTVHELTGAPARTFREWAVYHAPDFRGDTGDAETRQRPGERSKRREDARTSAKTKSVAERYVSQGRSRKLLNEDVSLLFATEVVRAEWLGAGSYPTGPTTYFDRTACRYVGNQGTCGSQVQPRFGLASRCQSYPFPVWNSSVT